ncbi:MAG: aldose 1-epimerase family protein [Bacteroidota bacterium]|nr:aldose 1-epimerase family protein [Bacteroidota bacterium]
MTTLFGRNFSRQELLLRVGSLTQLAGVRMMELRDGAENNVRIADVRSGVLRFQVTLDRGMDISLAEYKGIPLTWRSPNGDVHPAFYDRSGSGWSRSFSGGLMTGCGLTQVGAAGVDEGEELGLHGRLSHLPASAVSAASVWNNDKCVFRIEGNVREAAPFKENLLLHRAIETQLGGSTISVRDEVTNEGSSRTPLMLLYHINIGFPVLDEGTELLLNADETKPRDNEALKGIKEAQRFSPPIQNYKEQVFYHELREDGDGFASALLVNKELNLGVFVQFRKKELPRFIEWKMMGEGMYVAGMEPANCFVEGRAKERMRGTLQFLEPNERRGFLVRIGVVEGREQIADFVQENHLR